MKNKRLIPTILLVLFLGVIVAQKDIKIDYNEFSNLSGVQRSDVKKIKLADEIYFADHRDRYKQSLPLYLEVVKDDLNYSPLDWRIAMCYLHTEDKPQALDYLLRCDTSVSTLYEFYLGKAYHFEGDFAKAKESYQLFAETMQEEDQKLFFSALDVKRKTYDFDTVMQQLQDACNVGLETTSDSLNVVFENVRIINTSKDEIYPSLHPNGVLVFSSNKPTVAGVEQGYYQIYEAACDSMFVLGSPQGSKIYPHANENNFIALPYTTYFDGFLYQSMQSEGGDVMQTYSKGRKVKGMPVPKINSSSKEGGACFINDSVMVFSSDRGSKGFSDIYLTIKEDDGKWGKPVAVAGGINSSANDEVLTYYNGKLYFISNDIGGIGGYDIYTVPYLGDNSWGKVMNMGYPINTADNDMGYFPIDDHNAFYCGVRPGGVGGSDIYKVTVEAFSSMDTSALNTLTIDSVVLDIIGMMPADTLIVDSITAIMEGDSLWKERVVSIPIDSSKFNLTIEDEGLIILDEESDTTLIIQ